MGFKYGRESLTSIKRGLPQIKRHLILCLLITLFFVGFFVYTEIEQSKSVEIRATVENSELLKTRVNGKTRNKTVYTISYEFEGKSYTATIENDNKLENWRVGYRVKVFVNPKKPGSPFVKERKFILIAGAAVFGILTAVDIGRLKRAKDNEIVKTENDQ